MKYGVIKQRASLIFNDPSSPSHLVEGVWAYTGAGEPTDCYVALDVARASGGRFGPDPMSPFDDWGGFVDWAAECDLADAEPFTYEQLDCPVPRPSQVFAIGLNYADHASETSHDLPETPLVFTKYQSSLAGPSAEIPLVEGKCDWEVELVVVIGRTARDIQEAEAVKHIAGFSVGQDVSERVSQMAGERPQFNLSKSHPNFSPLGPVVVTLDELEVTLDELMLPIDKPKNPWDLAIRCERNGQFVQDARTSLMIHKIPRLISFLSSICELRAGDLIFTGTPSGVGMGMNPPQFLQPGDEIVSSIEGVGEIRNRCR